MNKYLPVLLEMLGAVLCAGAGVFLASGSSSLFGVGGWFCAGLALIFWRRWRVMASVSAVIAALLVCAGQVEDLVRGKESRWELGFWVCLVVLGVTSGALQWRRTRKHKVPEGHHDSAA